MSHSNYITASELGEFTYCKRAWWLRKQGLSPTSDEMVQGTLQHDQQFGKVIQLMRLKKLFLIIFITAVVLLLILFLITFPFFK